MKERLQPTLGAALSLLSALWLGRLLVAGSYYSLWDLLWYGKPLPGALPVATFIAASGLLALRPGLARPLLLVSATAALLGDDVRTASTLYALGLAASAYTLYWSRSHLAASAPLALALDHLLHVAARGLEPVEYPWGQAVLAGTLAAASLLAPPPDPGAPGPGLYSSLALLGLGAGSVSAALSASHTYGYTLTVYALAGLAAVALWLLASALTGRDPRARLLALLAPAAPLVHDPLAAGLTLLAGGAAAAAPSGTQGRRGPRGPLAGSTLYVLLAVAGVGVYAYPYLHLYPLADRLEAVLAVTALLVVALNRTGRVPGPPPTLAAAALLVAGLAVPAGLALQAAPISGSPGTLLHAATFNVHQGYDAWGRLNGLEVSRLVASLASQGYVVCLQEVDAGRLTSAHMNLPLALESMGVPVAYQPAIEGAYGVAVAGAGVSMHGGILLPSVGEQRAAVKALWRGVPVVSFHLGLSAEERRMQAEALLAFALEEPRAKLVCGDANEEEGPAIALLSTWYQLTGDPGGEGYTCCLGTGERSSIDKIGVLQGWGRIVWARSSIAPSDHLLLEAAVEVVR